MLRSAADVPLALAVHVWSEDPPSSHEDYRRCLAVAYDLSTYKAGAPAPAVILVLQGSIPLDVGATWWQVLGYVLPAGEAHVAVVAPSAMVRRVVRSLCWLPAGRQVHAVATFDEAVEWVEQRRQASLPRLGELLREACATPSIHDQGG